MPGITPLPDPPSRADPTNFAAEGDAFMSALPNFVTETNALAAALGLVATPGPGAFTAITATTSLVVGALAAISVSPAQFSAGDCGLAMFATNTAVGTESYFVGFGKNSDGAQQKAGILAFQVVSDDPTSGYRSFNIHTGVMRAGVYNDQYMIAGAGDHGVVFFPAALAASDFPGDGIVLLNGIMDINQGARDDSIVTFRSSDVAHGMTDYAVTTAFGLIQKAAAATGGVLFRAFSDAAGAPTMSLSAFSAAAADTTKSTAAEGIIQIAAALKSGTGVNVHGADANLFVFANGSVARHILDGDGDSHQDVGTTWTNFDDQPDMVLLDATSALLGRDPGGLRKTFSENFLAENRTKLAELQIVTFNEDGHHFINWSRFHMLHMGATRWLGDELAAVMQRLARLERNLIGA